jgi:hypothetical protein
MDRAMRLTADKQTPGTPSLPPLSSFSILQDQPVEHLLEVASESCVVFDSTVGSPIELISMIKARELAQAQLDQAKARIEQELRDAKEKEVKEK